MEGSTCIIGLLYITIRPSLAIFTLVTLVTLDTISYNTRTPSEWHHPISSHSLPVLPIAPPPQIRLLLVCRHLQAIGMIILCGRSVSYMR